MAAQEVVTLAALKAFIPLTDTASDDLLTVLLASTIAQVVKYLRVPIIETSLTDEAYTIVANRQHVFLKNVPVHGTVTVKENDITLTADTDYEIDLATGIITRIDAYWAEGAKTVKVSYKAGWADSDMPADIKFAILQQVKFYYRREGEIGVTSKTMPGAGEITVSEGYTLLKGVKTLLNPYRKVSPE